MAYICFSKSWNGLRDDALCRSFIFNLINKHINTNQVGRDRNRTYTNGEITIYWQADLCIHASLCYRELREVFNPALRPWINAYGASTSRILQIIERCPSRALTFRWNDESRNQDEKSAKLLSEGVAVECFDQANATGPLARIEFRPAGPAVITGEFMLKELVRDKEHPLPGSRMVSLCRCGASHNLPYCDGTHFKEGFKGL